MRIGGCHRCNKFSQKNCRCLAIRSRICPKTNVGGDAVCIASATPGFRHDVSWRSCLGASLCKSGCTINDIAKFCMRHSVDAIAILRRRTETAKSCCQAVQPSLILPHT